jgi:adenosylhomocysteinase
MARKTTSSDITDVSLSATGSAAIAWADGQMPVLRTIRERFAKERPLDGVTIAACLHVTAETANLVRTLMAGGADVAICASNPLSTQDEVAAALVAEHGAEVYARRGEDADTYVEHIGAVVDRGPGITMDDGADVISFLHARGGAVLEAVIGGTEDTTSGAIRVHALEEEGRLAFPVLALARARVAQLVETRHGTGQSALDGILRATNTLLAGRTLAVYGYGPCGQGIARRAQGLGSAVVVCEVDPVRALEARLDGYTVLPGVEAAARSDVLVTATGARDVIGPEHVEVLRDGAILANAGHFDVEISVAALRDAAKASRQARPLVEQFDLAGGRSVNLLAEGRVVNLAAAEGHPAPVMDIAFAVEALAVEHLVAAAGDLTPAVHQVPPAIDDEVARLALSAVGVEIDHLTDEQRRYLTSWS